MRRFIYPILLGVLALAMIPVVAVLWFRFGETYILSFDDVRFSPFIFGPKTLLWPGMLLARNGMHQTWIVGVLCLLVLAALIFGAVVRFNRKKYGWLRVLGISASLSLFYCEIGTLARSTPAPLPVTTRYDADPASRAVFERCWQIAYRRAELGTMQTWCFRPEIDTRGYESGELAGLHASDRLYGKDNLFGWTPLIWATIDGDEKEVARLLHAGADVNFRDRFGNTALKFAITRGPATCSMVDLLIRNGAKVNAADSYGYTALMEASRQPELVELLLKNGADVKTRAEGGRTALMVAASYGHVSSAKMLIAAGADINEEDKNGETPLLEAAGGNNAEMVSFLLHQGADVNHRDKSGMTSLWHVAITGYILKNSTIRVLLEHGATLDVKDNEGRALLDIMDPKDRAFTEKIVESLRANRPIPPDPPQSEPPARKD